MSFLVRIVAIVKMPRSTFECEFWKVLTNLICVQNNVGIPRSLRVLHYCKLVEEGNTCYSE